MGADESSWVLMAVHAMPSVCSRVTASSSVSQSVCMRQFD
jgi:hypothetical protein